MVKNLKIIIIYKFTSDKSNNYRSFSKQMIYSYYFIFNKVSYLNKVKRYSY